MTSAFRMGNLRAIRKLFEMEQNLKNDVSFLKSVVGYLSPALLTFS